MANKKQIERKVPAGGAATINGILYQMLWSLLRASQACFKNPELNNDELQGVTIILEPIGGGGDLVVEGVQLRSIEQLKARPDGGTWSLKEIIEKVIPDLYLAENGNPKKTIYRFITEGKIGSWKDVYKNFQSLKNREYPEDDPLSGLDKITPLEFGRKKNRNGKNDFWDLDEYTELTLFEKIVNQVRDTEDKLTTQKKLRTVLGHFEFVGGKDMRTVQEEIDSHLMTVIDVNDDLAQTRNSLAMELANLATQGDFKINSEGFFQGQGLNAIPLTKWGALRDSSHHILKTTLQNQYDQSMDVRLDTAKQVLADWPVNAPLLAITGDSGCGKSWLAFAISDQGQSLKPLSILINAGASIDVTLDRAAEIIWRDIVDHDSVIPLSRIAIRIQKVIDNPISPWLTLIIDGSLDEDQSKELLQQPWEEWGIRVAFTVNPRISSDIERQSKGRCVVTQVSNFTTGELHKYLELSIGEHWAEIPDFVRNQLRMPLLAHMYCQMVETDIDPEWKPQTEYELFAKFWSHIKEPLDGNVLITLAENYMTNARYPWSIQDMQGASGEIDNIKRLQKDGWIRENHNAANVSYEMPHDRFLNWACAHALLSQFRKDEISIEELCQKLQSYLNGTSSHHGYRLSFVPMDFLWIMCQDKQIRDKVPGIIAGLESSYNKNLSLYEELLPTLGSTILDALLVRLQEMVNDAYLPYSIIHSIRKIGRDEATSIGMKLLSDENPLLQRAGCNILETCPSLDAVDKLWEIYQVYLDDPALFLREHERNDLNSIRNELLNSLKSCCAKSPDWVENKIINTDSETESTSSLASLLSTIGGQEGRRIWEKHKLLLFDKVPDDKQQCLISCVNRYSDYSEIDWLIAKIGSKDGLVGPSAFSALARLSPERAINNIEQLPKELLAITRSGYADYLFAVAPDTMREKLLSMMKGPENLWGIASVYDGRTYFMDQQTLDFLLNELEKMISDLPEEIKLEHEQLLYNPLKLLGNINTRGLIDHLAKYQGSNLETKLCELVLRVGPRRGGDRGSFIRSEVIELLYRINGEGFTTAVNMLLKAESKYDRLDGLKLACKKTNQETISLLARMTENEECVWEGTYMEQCKAAEILACCNEWEPVIAFVRRVGVPLLNEIFEIPRNGLIPQPDQLKEIKEYVSENPSQATADDVIALGFGNQGHADVVRTVTEECEPTGDVALACVLAFNMLHDEDELNIPFLTKQLDVNYVQSSNALIANGTQEALRALEEFSGDNPSAAIAVNLVMRLDEPSSSIKKIRENIIHKIENGDTHDFKTYFYFIIQNIKDDEVISQILNHPVIEEFLKDEAFASRGEDSQANAIRCLAYIDSRSAFLAAKTALKNVDSHYREYYPPILAELDEDSAIELHLVVLLEEKTDSVIKSIGRTFTSLDMGDILTELFSSTDSNKRQVACIAAGWIKDTDQFKDRLTECLNDPEVSVCNTAARTLNQILIRQESELLANAIMEEENEDRKWLYLDCLSSLSDPGDQHQSWPIEGPEIGEELSPFQIKYISEKLKERRK